jgi:hypothetical protein
MIRLLLSLFRRHKPEQAPAVKEAREKRDSQFEEWGTVMREVDRVQKLAKGPARGGH